MIEVVVVEEEEGIVVAREAETEAVDILESIVLLDSLSMPLLQIFYLAAPHLTQRA